MTDLLLIRHGWTDTANKRLTGRARGVHLNDAGRQQAQALVERLAKVKLDAIYSSPLERALETAAPLAAARRLAVVKREGLLELDYGGWTGKSLRALARQKLWRVVQSSPSLAAFPEGESLRAAQGRAVAEIEAIRRAHPKGRAAVFSHGDTLKLAVAYYAGMPLDMFQRIVIAPASISILHFAGGAPRLVLLNDTGELELGV